MSKKIVPATLIIVFLVLGILGLGLHLKVAIAQENQEEKPIIVCTTNVLGSIVKELVGEEVDVVVLVNPGLCPADYDMKPSDIYALSKAKVFFYHGIPGEKPWLQNLIEAAGNENLTQVKVPGVYNTPEGAKKYIRTIGGNLSRILSIDLNDKIEQMINEIDNVANEIANEAQSLGVSNVNVICMKWQKTFVEWVGFNVVATYNPPETLSANDIANLIEIAHANNVALIIDNLQVSAEFGASIAAEVGAVHVVLTNFPGAIPETVNLAKMFQYNAKQLFDGLKRWQLMEEMKTLVSENENLKNQLTLYQSLAAAVSVIVVVELILLLVRAKKHS